jgi:hypothetical protein
MEENNNKGMLFWTIVESEYLSLAGNRSKAKFVNSLQRKLSMNKVPTGEKANAFKSMSSTLDSH